MDREIAAISPQTTNLFITKIPYGGVDKIDLVFMIDNSMSMADKQVMLSEAVPHLMRRLVEPLCVNNETGERQPALAGGGCVDGLMPEFDPVRDIHVAVLSSSLGGFGSEQCVPTTENPTLDDHAHLIGTLRNVPTYQNLGFLAWDPGGKKTPPGASDLEAFASSLRDLVEATGELGCGYEASLESWYRFLVEPDPPARLVIGEGRLLPEGIDEELLAQRQAFLRPDSLVAIVMLSDENDCSVAVGGQGYLVGDKRHLPRSTAACTEVGPNDPCCRPCKSDETVPPSGCLPLEQDPACLVGREQDDMSDNLNVRCFDQKRRFGVDFLYPVERYINGLTQNVVPDRNGNLVPNPLFVSPPGKPPRSKGHVFLAGIVGVPWQDVATNPDPAAAGLEYLTATEMTSLGRWATLLGDGGPATDPLMQESIDPRSTQQQNPILQAPIALPGSTTLNPINGHEFTTPNRRDLQYACIYPLTSPRTCTTSSCDCYEAPEKPLCRDPATGQYGETQYFAKAYPGVRQLQVLRGIEEQGIVASICPKVYDNSDDPNYGYGPAVQALIEQLSIALNGACLPRQLSVDPELGTVPCKVIEALPPEEGLSAAQLCAQPGRTELEPKLRRSVEKELRGGGTCDVKDQPSCSEMVMCRITPAQTEGPAALASCQNDETPLANGFCYIDGTQGIGNPALVSACGETEQRMVRIVSADLDNNPLPRNGATVFVACRGKGLNSVTN